MQTSNIEHLMLQSLEDSTIYYPNWCYMKVQHIARWYYSWVLYLHILLSVYLLFDELTWGFQGLSISFLVGVLENISALFISSNLPNCWVFEVLFLYISVLSEDWSLVSLLLYDPVVNLLPEILTPLFLSCPLASWILLFHDSEYAISSFSFAWSLLYIWCCISICCAGLFSQLFEVLASGDTLWSFLRHKFLFSSISSLTCFCIDSIW